MSDQPFRFLHAADFQLDQPLHGLLDIPDHLRGTMIDGAYRAAERVIDTAIHEQVSFVCLSGELLNLAMPAARSLAFLRDQFERLDEHGIAVYWAGSSSGTSAQWPTLIALPKSVHRFDSSTVQVVGHEVKAGLTVDVLGQSGARDVSVAEFCSHASGRYAVAVATGKADSRLMATRSVDYWALGGQGERKTLTTQPSVVHYPGTPQGRSPQSLGPHGCTLVEVRAPRDTRMRFVPCDVVRWQHERVMASAAASWDDITDLLSQRIQELRSQTPGTPLLIRWTFAAADITVDREKLRQLAERAMAWLKKQQGSPTESCWPVSVEVDAHQPIPASAYDEDTLLGDYLRSVRQLQENWQQDKWESNCGESLLSSELRWVADLSDPSVRLQVLREATVLGSALLRGEKVI